MNEAIQSILSPSGYPAAPIATLAWVLFAMGAAVLILVVIAVLLAVRGTPRIRTMLSRERSIIVLGLGMPAIVLTSLLTYGVWLMRVQLAEAASPVRIEVTGEQWWWRVVYDGPSPVVSANEIRVPVGRPVDFTLKSADVIHSFWVPSLGGKVDMIPGRTTRLTLTAANAGVFRGSCAEYCGGPHALMALDVVALPQDEYETWFTAEMEPAAPPDGETQQRGQSLFLAAGCGSCHTIRGTAASGTIGPDLTHIGSRRSVGHVTLRLEAENLQRFIHDGQSVKPGNRMPEFRVFSDDESVAVATYLLALK